jgi:DNA polymerase-1
VYHGITFRQDKFAEWLIRNNMAWPLLASGQLDLKQKTFSDMAKAHPILADLKEVRSAMGKMRLFEQLTIGPDGRNRSSLMPFGGVTGRNQPSSATFIFGASKWVRSLIRPEPGMGLAYIDFEQQEFGIAAALSGDSAMAAAYRSGDPYLAFGKQAGAIPPDGTKATHGAERAKFKQCVLAVQFGMGPESLSYRLGQPVEVARQLLRLHRETYPAFWAWSQAAVDRAMLTGRLETVFGWPIRLGPSTDPEKGTNARTFSNFPCQANGAEMLRLTCCMLVEAGIGLCAPIHDAVLVEGPADTIDDVVASARSIMAEASRIVLGGFEINTEARIVTYPERYVDEDGKAFWETVSRLAGPPPT